MFKFTMYFGMSKPDGSLVTEKEFTTFLKQVVSQELKGFTVTNALGYYEGEAELSKVLTCVSYANVEPELRQIGFEYCKAFGQKSVLMEATTCTITGIGTFVDTKNFGLSVFSGR